MTELDRLRKVAEAADRIVELEVDGLFPRLEDTLAAWKAGPKETEHGPWGSERQPRIETRCPMCKHGTLFIGSGGHLTCSWLECPNPSLSHVHEKLLAERRELVEALRLCIDTNAQHRGTKGLGSLPGRLLCAACKAQWPCSNERARALVAKHTEETS